MGKVPDHVIAEIRDRTDLVELIGGYVQLKRSGRNWQGLCPFHQEKTPSFNVSPDRGIYHCFGCGVTGDGIKFLMEHDHLSFPEALKELAGAAGIDLSPYEGRGGRTEEFDLLYRAHAVAERLYRETLRGPAGKAAREEIGRRGYSDEIVEDYRLGASPDSWDRLLKACAGDGIRPDLLERAGLALPRRSESGASPGHYDRFRGRLMFPIQAAGGKVIGFGGRVLGEGEPKYLNSPESPLFRKRKTLYGIPQAQAAMRESRRAILVEGYTDVLALAQADLRGALAALGTAFTTDHAGWLARSCDEVIVLFDGDEAGRRAAVASCGPLLGAGLEVRMVMLPAGEDPDSFLRARGGDALRERLEKAGSVLDTLLGEEAYGEGAARERALRRTLAALAPIDDELRRRVYLEDLANRVGLPLSLLAEQIAELRRREAQTERRLASREAAASREKPSREAGAPPPPDREGRDESQADAVDEDGVDGAVAAEIPDDLDDAAAGPMPAVERTFLGVLVHSESHGESLLEKYGPGAFEHPVARRIVKAASAMISTGRSPQAAALLAAMASDRTATELLGRLTVSKSYGKHLEQQAEDCCKGMELRSLDREMERVMSEMRKATAQGDVSRARECAQKKRELRQMKEAIRAPQSST